MNKNVFLLFALALLVYSCDKHKLKMDVLSTDEEFFIDNKVEVQFINCSTKVYSLISNNLDTIYNTDTYSFYYRIYDVNFKEVKKNEYIIFDGEYALTEEYALINEEKKDSLFRYQEYIMPANDTLILTFFTKKRFYEDPLFYKEYDLEFGKEYYIRFFYRNMDIQEAPTTGKLFIGEIKSPYYKLRF